MWEKQVSDTWRFLGWLKALSCTALFDWGFSVAEKPSCVPLGSSSVGGSTVHCPSAAVCIGILPGLGAYSGSSDSESSSDSEGTINSTGKIVSSVFRGNSFFDGP